MAYFRDNRFGIEYRPEEPEPETPWLLWTLGLAAVVALCYGSLAAYRAVVRWVTTPTVAAEAPRTAENPSVVTNAVEPNVSAPKVAVSGERPRKVRNLLMKLDAAIAATNYPVQIATMEELRALPGNPVADLDATLAKSLGRLNLRMLFDPSRRNEWVKRVEVKRGNSATRIAAEYGTTLKCIERLNGDVSSIRAGSFLWVMKNPKFRLSVYRKTQVADLFLNGKFFKRYYFTGTPSVADGSYTFPANTRAFFAGKKLSFVESDLAELEMLLPKGANMIVADFR